jgi:hypothetical protein
LTKEGFILFYHYQSTPLHYFPSVCTGRCRQTAKGEHRWRGNFNYFAGCSNLGSVRFFFPARVGCLFNSDPTQVNASPTETKAAWRKKKTGPGVGVRDARQLADFFGATRAGLMRLRIVAYWNTGVWF